LHQFIRFLLTGVLATLLQYAFLEVTAGRLRWSPAVGSGLGYIAGSILSYAMNYYFTFRSDAPHMKAAPRFYMMVGIGWLLNTTTMALLADIGGWNKWVSQVLATLFTLLWNFLAARKWVFK